MFKKKTEAEIVAEDRKLIETNSKTVGKLTMLANDNEELISKLKDLQEKLKYLKPVKSEEAMEADRKIANKIDDLKIELSRFNGDTSYRIGSLISDILLLLVNRKD